MRYLTIILTFSLCLTGCINQDNQPAVADKQDTLSKSDKDLTNGSETQPQLHSSFCVFDNPDTSLSGIKLRDAESVRQILKVDQLEGDTTYHFTTRDKRQLVSLTVHPGDGFSQVSIFQISYNKNQHRNTSPLVIEELVTEKGIKLGLTKNEIIARLGNCYTVSDSTKSSIRLNYRLESPQDSRTNLLARQNMPVYYSYYFIRDDKLAEFGFGFEYP